MAHLNQTEMYKCMDSLFTGLFGSELYMRWRRLKRRLMFDDEKEFITCILNMVENEVLTINSATSEKDDQLNSTEPLKFNLERQKPSQEVNSSSAASDNVIQVKEEVVFDIDSDLDDYDEDECINGDVVGACYDAVGGECDDDLKEEGQPMLLDICGESNGMERCGSDAELQIQDDCDVATGLGGDAYHCPLCSATFPRKASLVRHTSTVHGRNEQYRCTVCQHSFNSRSDKIKHEQAAHADQIKTYRCSVCDKMFTSEKSMIRHQEHVHYKLKNYQCLLCGRCFAESWIMKKHINRVHHNMRYEFPCANCTREFATKHELRVHQARVHI